MKSIASARRKSIWPRLGVTILAVCLCGRETAAGGTVTFRTVALSGDPAPGTGDNFGSLDFVIINAEGQTALVALLTGEPLDDPCTDQPGEDPPPEQGIWSEGPGMLSLVAHRGTGCGPTHHRARSADPRTARGTVSAQRIDLRSSAE